MMVDEGETTPQSFPPTDHRPPTHSDAHAQRDRLVDELKMHGAMLQRVGAQQRYILDEILRIRSSRGQPTPTMPGGDATPPVRATTCA